MPHRKNHSPDSVKRTGTYSKVFKWQLAKPGDPMPVSVEVVGSFNSWKPVAMPYDRISKIWQLTLHGLPGNCTHHYMLLVNGQPANDRFCDGLAKPETEEEMRFQLQTLRGPRVFMLFSQTK